MKIHHRTTRLRWNEKITKEVLEHLYVEEKQTYEEIAAHFGCSGNTVMRLIREYNITPRKRGKPIVTEDLIHLYVDEELPIRAIAEHYGCSRATISLRLKELGISRHIDRGEPLASSVKKQMAKAYDSGNSMTFLAKSHAVSLWAVQSALREQGVSCRPGRPRTATNYDEIRYLYEEKRWTTTRIANLLKVKPSTVATRLKEIGVVLRGHSVDLDDVWLRSRWEQGDTVQEISQASGCSYHTVRKRLMARGWYTIRERQQFDKEKIKAQYHSGQYTYRALGDMYGCAPTTIRNIVLLG